MITIARGILIDDSCISYRFSRSGGNGGQNVNKLETRVELLYDIASDTVIPCDVRERLAALAGKNRTADGKLSVTSETHRTQEQNREAAYAKFIELAARAAVRPKPRRATKPGKAAREKRLAGKKRDGAVKENRRRPRGDD